MKSSAKSSQPKNDRSELITALRRAHEENGFLPPHVLEEIRSNLGIPMSRIYSVVTFFDEFSLEKRGRNQISVCRGSACGVKGGKDVLKAVKDVVGVDEGETSSDYKYTLKAVSCFGNCAIAPAILINKDLYGDLTPERVRGILNSDD